MVGGCNCMGKTTNSERRSSFQQERVKNIDAPENEFGAEMYPDVKEVNQKEEKEKKQQRKRRNEPKAAKRKNHS